MSSVDAGSLAARQVAAAVARRGSLPVLYRALSEHFTAMLQKLYPVRVLVGPRLSDPAHIEVHSATVYLDSRMLGSHHDIATGAVASQRILVSLGAGLHEVLHGVHTKPWTVERNVELDESEDPAMRQLAADRRILEEPRMEATGVRDYQPTSGRGRFLRKAIRAAVADIVAPSLCEPMLAGVAAGAPVTRDMCGTSMTYLYARSLYGTVDVDVLAPLAPIWLAVLGDSDMRALDDLYRRLLWVPDGDDDALDDIAHEYRAIIGPVPPPPARAGAARGFGSPDEADNAPGAGDAAGPADIAGDARGDAQGPTVGSLRDAVAEALEAAAAGQLAQFNEELSLQEVLAAARDAAHKPAEHHATGTGLPTGHLPGRGVNRPAQPDEVRGARVFTTRMRRARQQGKKLVSKRHPAGTFNGRQRVRAQAQRDSGLPVTSREWEVEQNALVPLDKPHVGLIIDTSSSMRFMESALGSIAWQLQRGYCDFDGRMAIALFGDGCELMTDGRKPMKLVPSINVGGGTAFAGDAVELVSDALEMTNRHRPRFLYVLSDGGWSDTRAGVQRIRRLRDLGVPTIHVVIGKLPPLSVEADRICLIDDPDDVMTVIANDSIDAMRGRARRRHIQQPGSARTRDQPTLRVRRAPNPPTPTTPTTTPRQETT